MSIRNHPEYLTVSIIILSSMSNKNLPVSDYFAPDVPGTYFKAKSPSYFLSTFLTFPDPLDNLSTALIFTVKEA